MKLFGAGTESLPVEGRLADFDGATGWLNSEPLTPTALRGQGRARRLLDLHLHQLAAHACRTSVPGPRSTRTTAWSWSACTRPSSRSSTTSTTCAGRSRRWASTTRSRSTTTTRSGARSPTTTGRPSTSPTPKGRIRHHHFGEGGYEECELVVQQLLREAGREVDGKLVAVAPEGLEVQADWATLESPETYLGYEQAQNFASPAARGDEPRPTRCRIGCGSTSGRSPETGRRPPARSG